VPEEAGKNASMEASKRESEIAQDSRVTARNDAVNADPRLGGAFGPNDWMRSGTYRNDGGSGRKRKKGRR
jgi:hypothetical protein